MLTFDIQDMSCGHCAGSITKAIKTIDPQADVNIDLAHKKVTIEGKANAKAVEKAIAEAGFTPVLK
ncbi:MAG: copper chaperone [Oxalobacter sp.]|nr:MAG: copper chaperone [Oxalobacter sp.]